MMLLVPLSRSMRPHEADDTDEAENQGAGGNNERMRGSTLKRVIALARPDVPVTVRCSSTNSQCASLIAVVLRPVDGTNTVSPRSASAGCWAITE